MDPTPLRVVFFDLGDTLVERDPDALPDLRFRWLSGAEAALAALRQSGLAIGVISNTGSLSRDQLQALMPAGFEWSLFDADLVLLSSEAGIEKPDSRLFRLALSRAMTATISGMSLRVDPAECLFCGESMVETLVAQQVGMRAARVQRGAADVGAELTDVGHLADRLRDAGLID